MEGSESNTGSVYERMERRGKGREGERERGFATGDSGGEKGKKDGMEEEKKERGRRFEKCQREKKNTRAENDTDGNGRNRP